MDLLFILISDNMNLGLIITLVGVGIVFVALAVLTIIFNQIPRLLKLQIRPKQRKTENNNRDAKMDGSMSGETHAAIALALHLYMNDLHDQESSKLTISKISKKYSPWNSKIYGLRNYPNWK